MTGVRFLKQVQNFHVINQVHFGLKIEKIWFKFHVEIKGFLAYPDSAYSYFYLCRMLFQLLDIDQQEYTG